MKKRCSAHSARGGREWPICVPDAVLGARNSPLSLGIERFEATLLQSPVGSPPFLA